SSALFVPVRSTVGESAPHCRPGRATDSGRDDGDRNLCDDVVVQFDADRVRAGGLDVTGQLDALAIEQRPARVLDRGGDVGLRDRTEQLAFLARARVDVHSQLLEVALDLLSVTEVADVAGVASALDLRDLLLGALAPRDRRALRDE